MAVKVEIDRDNGSATLSFDHGQDDQALKLAILDLVTHRYLTERGWVKKRTIFCEAQPVNGSVLIHCTPEVTSQIKPGARLLIEDIFAGLRLDASWPRLAKPETPPAPVAPAVVVPPAAQPEPLPTVAAATDPEPVSPSPPAVPKREPPRRSTGWFAGAAGLAVGIVLSLALFWLIPSRAAPITPAVSAPSPALVKRETEVAQREVALNQRLDALKKSENASGQDIQAVQAERDLLQTRLQTAERDLSQAQLALARQTAAPTASSEVAQARATAQALQQQLDNAKTDQSMALARLTEQEKLIEDRDTQIRTLRAQVTGNRSGPDAVLQADLQQQLATLTSENAALTEKSEAQTRTISEWSNDRVAMQKQIMDLQAQLETKPAVAEDKAIWLAAAASAAGTVQAVENQTTSEGAIKLVMKACGRNCELVGAYRNTCFSVARPAGQPVLSGNWWTATDPNPETATSKAIYECERGSGAAECSSKYTVCSPAGLKP